MLAEKEQAGLVRNSVISLLGQEWTSFYRSLCWPVCIIHTDVHMHTHHASALGPRSSSSHRQGLERGCFWILRLWSNSGEKPSVPGQGVADSAGGPGTLLGGAGADRANTVPLPTLAGGWVQPPLEADSQAPCGLSLETLSAS